jgi:NAD(P)H-hydrate epimerase
MRILQPQEIKKADRLTLKTRKITSLALMEKAVSAFLSAFLRRFPKPGPGLIVAGPGNNGGDGLALARMLTEKKIPVVVFIPDFTGKMSPERAEQEKKLPPSLKVIRGKASDLQKELQRGCRWVCDALFGVGLNRKPEGEWAELIELLNSFGGLKIALDVPSGFQTVNQPGDAVFQSDWTGSFHCPRLGFLLPSNQKYVAEFEVLDIGLSEPEPEEWPVYFIEKKDIKTIIRPRKRFSHKGTFGHGMLISGSKGKMGAAVLASRAMLRSGVGLATVYGPSSGRIILQTAVPEAMWISDPEKDSISACPPLGTSSAVGVGPGIGNNPQTAKALKQILDRAILPLVADADALNILSENKQWLRLLPRLSLLTPHPGEFDRLAGKSATDEEVMRKALEFSRKYGIILILKGAFTFICHPDGRSWFNSKGNPGMATAGSGDALTGLLTGLLAQGYPPLDAALLGVYWHGFAGDLAADYQGQASLITSDLIDRLGKAFLEISA